MGSKKEVKDNYPHYFTDDYNPTDYDSQKCPRLAEDELWDVRIATQEEILWLLECVEKGKALPFPSCICNYQIY